MDLDAFLTSKSGLEMFSDVTNVLNTVESHLVNIVPDDYLLKSSKSVLCFLSDVSSSRSRKFEEREMDLFIKLLTLVLEGCLLFKRCNKNYHGVVKKLCEVIQTLKSNNFKIRILKNCYHDMLQLCVKESVADKTKLKLLSMCSHLLHGIKESVKLEILPKISKTLYEISKALGSFGDYSLQTCATEILFQFSAISPEIQENIARTLKQDREQFLELTFEDFDVNCRMLLNDINSTQCDDKKVISIACYKAFIGSQQILKPQRKNYNELWIDFNLGTRSISFICDAYSLRSERDHRDKTEFITIERKYVDSYDFQKVFFPKLAIKDLYNLKLKLLEPCLCKLFKSVEGLTKIKCLSLFFKVSSIPSFMDVFILPQIFSSKAKITEKSSHKEFEETLNVSPHLETSHNFDQPSSQIHMLSIVQQISTWHIVNNEKNSTFQKLSSSENSSEIQSSSTFRCPCELILNSEGNLAQFVKIAYSCKGFRRIEHYEYNLSVTDPTFEMLAMSKVQTAEN